MIYFSFYFLSFLPLWISIVIIDLVNLLFYKNEHPWTERISIVTIIILFFVSLLFQKKLLENKSKQGVEYYTLESANEEKLKVSDYIITYVLPLLAFDFTKWEEMFLFIIIFSILGYLYIQHNVFQSNLILEVMGYRIYHCIMLTEKGCGGVQEEVDKYVVSKNNLNGSTKKIQTRKINNEYHIDIYSDKPYTKD